MPHAYDRIILHTVWGTKHKQAFLIPMVTDAICAYIAGTCDNLGVNAIACEAVYDHVHLLHTLPRTMTIADLMERIKTDSSKWIKSVYPDFFDFAWQKGYGTFSVGHYTLDRTVTYVQNQRDKHLQQDRYRNFEDELKFLLKLHGVDFDVRYFLK